jgi:peptide chain release factor 2
LQKQLEALEEKMAAPGFWDDGDTARSTMAEAARLRLWVDPIRKLGASLSDLKELQELADAEDDAETRQEIAAELDTLQASFAELEFQLMLGGEDDAKNALLTIHPGAGGLESQDWAQMLLRMYVRYCERHGWECDTLDLQAGEGAGIKDATLEIRGDYAFGRLKAENGVHRLVRISPFDADQRRHTSFASVFVYPEIEGDVQVEIRDADLRIDTFRASGAGGQHVNKTSSAVRITHLPTRIVASCQSERSQHRNRDSAMKMLRAKLYSHYREIEEAKRAEKEPEKKEIGFGSQIRSYVFQPYTMVKDHRTSTETSNVQAVMDGDLDAFVESYLKWDNEVRQGSRSSRT